MNEDQNNHKAQIRSYTSEEIEIGIKIPRAEFHI